MKRLTNQWLNLCRLSVAAMIFCCIGNAVYAQRHAIKPELMDREILMGNELETILPYFGSKRNVINWASSFIEYDQIKGVVKNDFLINDDTGGSCNQQTSDVASFSNGNYIVVWCDSRSGYTDIYAQLFDSNCQSLGNEFKVNEKNEYNLPVNPSVAASKGSFVISWQAYTSDMMDCAIFAQRFDSVGNLYGVNYKVNDDSLHALRYKPDMVMGSDGSYIIAWADWRNDIGYPFTNSDIYYQRFDNQGIPLGANISAKSDSSFLCLDYYCSIDMDTAKSFVIAWRRSLDIYAQRFDSTGAKQGINFIVNDDIVNAAQRYPCVAMMPEGKFVVTWPDDRNGIYEVFAQKYNSNGDTLGNNFKISDSVGTFNTPGTAILKNKDMVITWRNWNGNLYAQNLDSLCNKKGSNYTVNETPCVVMEPSIAATPSGGYFIVWDDSRNGLNNYDIYSQEYDSLKNIIGVNLKINGDKNTAWQVSPTIAVNNNGNCVVCWQDARDGSYDCYTQRFDMNGSLNGINSKVNDDTCTSNSWAASVTVEPSGKYAVCWDNERLFLKIYDSSGFPIGSVITVDSNHSGNEQAVFLSNGNIAIVWEGWEGADKLFACVYDSMGSVIKQRFEVNETDTFCWFPSLAKASDGRFVVVWQDYRSGSFEIYAQLFDSLGNAAGSNYKVAAGNEQCYPSVAMSNSGNFVVAWQTSYMGPWVKAQKFDSTGAPIDTVFVVNDNSSYGYLYPTAAYSPDGSKFIIGWNDYSNSGEDPDFAAQVYDGITGGKIGANTIVNDDSASSWAQQTTRSGSNIACNNDNIFFVWQDNRRNLGWDIYGKITDWGLSGVQSGHDFTSSRISYALMQNAPNPTSGQTTIKYQLAKGGRVSLKVYNTLGQVVKTLINEDKQPGYYSVKWDGKNDENQKTAAGIYLYRLQSGDFTSTKKMVILR